jgi:hypothetical protein
VKQYKNLTWFFHRLSLQVLKIGFFLDFGF